MHIGELATKTGVNVETIRYYEREGILPRPARALNNYRLYSETHQRRLRFVRRARALGFTLEEVRALLRMVDGGDYSCSEVKAFGERHLDEMRSRIADLRRMERTLTALTACCSGTQAPDCSMLETLFES